jgi:hypothetical protein
MCPSNESLNGLNVATSRAKCASIETSSRPENLDFLTESEKQTIVRCDMEQQAEVPEDNPRVLAQRSIEAPNGIKLTFEAFIGDRRCIIGNENAIR